MLETKLMEILPPVSIACYFLKSSTLRSAIQRWVERATHCPSVGNVFELIELDNLKLFHADTTQMVANGFPVQQPNGTVEHGNFPFRDGEDFRCTTPDNRYDVYDLALKVYIETVRTKYFAVAKLICCSLQRGSMCCVSIR